MFRDVSPAAATACRPAARRRVRVLSTRSAPPSTTGYDQTIPAEGYGYLTTRDGTKLAINVRCPAGPGPYPTLVEYSGYGYANPAGARERDRQIANLLGYAVVDVNMRGTGCSGGAFDYFEPLQGLDGYDVIETVARQPWVLHHKVGMMGVSYGGISQLFVGADEPAEPGRDHAAVGDRQHRHDALPGRDPQHRLRPVLGQGPRPRRAPGLTDRRPGAGPASASRRATRRARRTRRCTQAVDLLTKIDENQYYCPRSPTRWRPVKFVHKIQAPGVPRLPVDRRADRRPLPDLAEPLHGHDAKWFTFTNGTHIDSLDPVTFNRWFDFLELYVAQRAPNALARRPARARADDLPARPWASRA